MRVPVEALSPGMQHAQKADLGPQMLRISRYLSQRGGTSLEQESKQRLLVLPDQRHEPMRQAEDEVVIGHLCARAHKCLYVLFPVMLCSIAANAIRADIVGNNNT